MVIESNLVNAEKQSKRIVGIQDQVRRLTGTLLGVGGRVGGWIGGQVDGGEVRWHN